MRCLIDADMLRYEVAACAEFKDEDTGEHVIREFDYVVKLLDQKISEIEKECWADEPSILFLTADSVLYSQVNRKYEAVTPIPNFREGIAKVKPYKGNRKNEKPYHYANLTAYMLAHYNIYIAVGMEADDVLAIEQTKAEPFTTIICTRDKDLRMVPGMHFGWACGKQPQFGPRQIDGFGEIRLVKNNKEIKGEGIKFFYSQIITGDSVDNIPGLPRGGPVKSFETLAECESEGQMFERVLSLYRDKYDEEARGQMLEQARLLWMVRELDEEGQPVMWEMFDERQ